MKHLKLEEPDPADRAIIERERDSIAGGVPLNYSDKPGQDDTYESGMSPGDRWLGFMVKFVIAFFILSLIVIPIFTLLFGRRAA